AGALLATGNASTIQGNVVLNPGATIGVNSGVTLNLPGIVSGADLTKVGAGTLVLLSTNSYTGQTTVDQGLLQLQNSGNALASSGATVNPGATLTLENNTGNATNLASRLGDIAPLNLNGGTFNLIGGNGVGVNGVAT